MSVLKNATVLRQLREAWDDSNPGKPEAHEEGGFILKADDGSLIVRWWPRGEKDQIEVPEHPGGQFEGMLIVATFHTHPNPLPEYQQEPGLTDIYAVQDDLDLKHAEYEGEYVIAKDMVYRIRPNGMVESLTDLASQLAASSNDRTE